ncbi:glutathione S-transferase [Pelagibius litoralis]|uniref:Glutathione S-transferase n=1 Tax=Pelagibius litoralis TaxID=374515 RepID=A0A967C8D6_9PROT|nr:glutathione S-transferase N-terminal domain-containing protein [Pelagibius litoralis]NIA68607.1 glutathione S-transferase [Pelagibius litoralis]
MQLFYSPTSPYARKCRVVARERGLMAALEEVVCNPMEDPPELQSKNPLGKVPALVLDDGTAVFDSPVIAEYLDGLGGAETLIPAAGPERFKVLVAAALGQGMTDAAFNVTMEGRRPDGESSPAAVERWRAAILRGLDHMTAHIQGQPGDLTMGHIACGCALGYLDLRHGDLNWRGGRDGLAAWFAAFDARPSMRETDPN